MSEYNALSNYISLDIETTGFSREHDHIIEIAAIEYRDGIKVAEFSTLVNPGIELPPKVTELTGITQQDIKCAPALTNIIPSFLEFIGDKLLLGHNLISFDIPFIEHEMSVDLSNSILDTCKLAREWFPDLPSYRLSYLKDILELNDGISHRASADAETTNALLQACMNPFRYNDLYMVALEQSKQEVKPNSKHRHWKEQPSHKNIHPIEGCTSCNTPLYKKNIVFTGEMKMPRAAAMQMAVNAGATIKSAVSSKTDYLVVGEQDITIVGFDGMSNKEETAYTLNASGKASIQIISEEDFLALLATKIDSIPEEPEQDDMLSEGHEQAIFNQLMAVSATMLEQMGLADSNIISLKELGNMSVVCFVDESHPVCYIRSRKKQSYISFFQRDAGALPSDKLTLTQQASPPLVRANISCLEDITYCVDALRAALLSRIGEYRTFDCCARYQECSDAQKCVHPRITEALGCTYGKRLRAGIIYYGKNRNID